METHDRDTVDLVTRYAVINPPEGPYLAGAGKALTAKGRQTKQWREPDHLRTKNENDRLLAAKILTQAFIDYHKAKQLIRKQDIRDEQSFESLGEAEKGVVLEGKAAWEWFINPPHKYLAKKKWTLERVCDVLKFDIDRVRNVYLWPSTWRAYCKENARMPNKVRQEAA